MVRPTDMEMTVIKKVFLHLFLSCFVFTVSSLETRSMAHHAGLHEKAPGSVRKQKEYGKHGQKSLLWLSWEGVSEAK